MISRTPTHYVSTRHFSQNATSPNLSINHQWKFKRESRYGLLGTLLVSLKILKKALSERPNHILNMTNNNNYWFDHSTNINQG